MELGDNFDLAGLDEEDPLPPPPIVNTEALLEVVEVSPEGEEEKVHTSSLISLFSLPSL